MREAPPGGSCVIQFCCSKSETLAAKKCIKNNGSHSFSFGWAPRVMIVGAAPLECYDLITAMQTSLLDVHTYTTYLFMDRVALPFVVVKM